MSDALKSAIRDAANALGFERVGFCTADPTPHAEFLDGWLAQGKHGTMDWLARNPHWRKDIRTRFEWAKSFVVLNIEYSSPANHRPRIARYALGADYHEIYAKALQQLETEIKRKGGPNTQAKWYQDTGPFLERAIAQQAGLGWVGKNTMLIDPRRGSWSFLALIVTSLELPTDAPGTDHCGTCTRCLQACPTDAFPAPYQLDATRCISYLTIEHEGPIDPALRPAMGEWVFGCDICNEVCPWNRDTLVRGPGSGVRSQRPLAPDSGLRTPDIALSAILTSKPEHLHKRIAGTPLERTGGGTDNPVGHLKRNAAIAAGNARDETLLPALEQALRTGDEMVQEAVIWALEQYGAAARPVLARSQKHVANEALRERIVAALASSGVRSPGSGVHAPNRLRTPDAGPQTNA